MRHSSKWRGCAEGFAWYYKKFIFEKVKYPYFQKILPTFDILIETRRLLNCSYG